MRAPRRDRPTTRGRNLWPLTMTLVAALAGAGGWAARGLFKDPDSPPVAESFVTVKARQGEIERSVNLPVSATWHPLLTVNGSAAGTVTAVPPTQARVVKSDEMVVEVDLVPVVIARGDTPAFRDLKVGTSGRDVRQLQEFLRDCGVRKDGATGQFDEGTAQEVKTWQGTHDIPRTGRIALGQLVFVPTLPATIRLSDTLAPGVAVAPGAPLFEVVEEFPRFTVSSPEAQARLLRTGQEVSIDNPAGGEPWRAVIESMGAPAEDGSTPARLASRGKDAICGAECANLPPQGQGGLVAAVSVVPRTRGMVIPTSALRVAPDGAKTVLTEGGDVLTVDIVGQSGGQAIVTGVAEGAEIRVPIPEGA